MRMFLKRKPATSPTFVRSSVAYDGFGNQVAVNVPRYNFPFNGLMLEEATTNILPESQSLSLSEAYTTGSINGSYTFSIQGTSGSITLSGGATGTVTPGTPVTATVSNATVTLTPTGTCTSVQVENKAYQTTWQIGGTPRTISYMTIPNTVLNLSEGTIEAELYMTPSLYAGSGGNTLFRHDSDGAHDRINLYRSTHNWGIVLTSHTGSAASIETADSTTTGNIVKITGRWKSDAITITVNGITATQGSTAPSGVPSVAGTAYLGSRNTTQYSLSSNIRDFVISKTYRTDAEVAARAKNPQGFPIDNNVTYALPLRNNLKAYRIGVV